MSSSRATGQAALVEVLQAVDTCSTELASLTRSAQPPAETASLSHRLLGHSGSTDELKKLLAHQVDQATFIHDTLNRELDNAVKVSPRHWGAGLIFGRRLALESPQWLAPCGKRFDNTPARFSLAIAITISQQLPSCLNFH